MVTFRDHIKTGLCQAVVGDRVVPLLFDREVVLMVEWVLGRMDLTELPEDAYYLVIVGCIRTCMQQR